MSESYSGTTIDELLKALQAIAEGYAVHHYDDRFILVMNPEYQPDNGSNPRLVIDVPQVRSMLMV